ncbi:MAG: hypothetical protein ACRC1K_09070, partial [Planctomycetia bacterium]
MRGLVLRRGPFFLVAASVLAAGGPAFGQADDWASPEFRPRLVLNAGGPTASVRALDFSADGRRLYVGGLDKAVYAYDVRGDERNVFRTAARRAVYAQTLRWEIARGLRGAVFAVAASPTEPRVAFGGYSARDSLGDIVVYDVDGRRVDRLLTGHRQTVVSVKYHPEGKRLLSCGLNGELRSWTLQTGESVVVQPAHDRLDAPLPIAWLDGETAVCSRPNPPTNDGSIDWRLVKLRKVGLPAFTAVDFPELHTGRITALAVDG